jgi:hypothetical protein
MKEIEEQKPTEDFKKCGTMIIWEMMANMTDEQKKEFDDNLEKSISRLIYPSEPK